MEELKDTIVEMRADVKEVKEHVIKLVAQGAVHNTVLTQHEQRSTNLENRVKPIEDAYRFVGKLCASILAILSLLATLATIYHYVFVEKSSPPEAPSLQFDKDA